MKNSKRHLLTASLLGASLAMTLGSATAAPAAPAAPADGINSPAQPASENPPARMADACQPDKPKKANAGKSKNPCAAAGTRHQCFK